MKPPAQVEGQLVSSRTGRQYRIANVQRDATGKRETLQIVRAQPKVRGKAAVKAAKRQRRQERQHGEKGKA